jgi:hypothetical protein
MKLVTVDSRSLRQIGYDAETRELHVRFKTSATRYIYEDVPPEVFDRLMAAESKGAFVNAEIKPVYAVRTA